MRIVIADRTSQKCQLEISITHGTYEVSQGVESRHNEEHVNSLFVPSSSTVVNHGKFQKFVPSIKNYIAPLDTYTID